MKTIVEALQDLYVALGGKEEDVANLVLNPDLIEKIAEVVPSGSGLPEVTPEDAGDVLTVSEDGEWEAAAPTGAGSALLVSITTQDNNVFTMDKTYSEIKAAASSSGVLCIIDFPEEYSTFISVIGFFEEDGYNYTVYLPDLEGLTDGDSPYVYFKASSPSGYPTFTKGPS